MIKSCKTSHQLIKAKTVKPYIYTQKIANIFDHIQEPLDLDRSRLGLENKFLENKSGRIFFSWGCVNQPFILFIHHIGGETVLFIIQTSYRMRYFTIFQDKLDLVNIQGDQSCAFSETVQKISKITDMASRFSFLVRGVTVVECWVTLQHNNEYIIKLFFVI